MLFASGWSAWLWSITNWPPILLSLALVALACFCYGLVVLRAIHQQRRFQSGPGLVSCSSNTASAVRNSTVFEFSYQAGAFDVSQKENIRVFNPRSYFSSLTNETEGKVVTSLAIVDLLFLFDRPVVTPQPKCIGLGTANPQILLAGADDTYARVVVKNLPDGKYRITFDA